MIQHESLWPHPDNRTLYLVGAATLKAPHPCSELLDRWRWKNLASILLTLVIYHSAGLTWPSALFYLDDCGGLAVWSLGQRWACVSPLGVLSSDTTRGYMIYVWLKGFSTHESQSLKERAYIVRTPVHAQDLWNFIDASKLKQHMV